MSESSRIPTLIFDEVDAGVGGGVAEIVGKKLRLLGHGRQVLCVTHLPQVASQAHHHYRVEKSSVDDATTTAVSILDEAERLEEIARMLGGVKITEHRAVTRSRQRNDCIPGLVDNRVGLAKTVNS
jgi:DNA repair protein RecN (Recombination protein N)